MKITILGTAYPLRGGIAHYVALLYEHLRKKHDVNIITFSLQYPKILFPGKTQEEKGEDLLKVPGKQMMNTVNPFSWFRTAFHILKTKPDLLIFKYWMPFFAPCYGTITLLTKIFNRNIKVIYICDNIIPHERRIGDIFLTKYAFMTVDGGIVQSDAVEKDFVALFPNKKFINTPHPVYTIFGNILPKGEAKKELKLDDEKIILFFGYIRPYKGLDILIDAMPEILKKVKVKLVAVGEAYEDELKYRNHIEKLGLSENVILNTDYVPNNEVGKFFSAADVVVLPYKSATQSGIVQIAYNFNKPVIATDVGGLSEVVINEKTGFIVEPNSPKKLAEAVIRFYEENKESIFVENVIQEKQKYSWDRMVESIEKLYEIIKK